MFGAEVASGRMPLHISLPVLLDVRCTGLTCVWVPSPKDVVVCVACGC